MNEQKWKQFPTNKDRILCENMKIFLATTKDVFVWCMSAKRNINPYANTFSSINKYPHTLQIKKKKKTKINWNEMEQTN